MSQVAIKMEELSPVKKKLSFEIPWNEVKKNWILYIVMSGKRPKLKVSAREKFPVKYWKLILKNKQKVKRLTILLINIIGRRWKKRNSCSFQTGN